MAKISIKGLDKGKLLLELHRAAHEQYPGQPELDERHARAIIGMQSNFDAVHGRTIGMDLSQDTVDTSKYDNANGYNLAEDVIERLREETPANVRYFDRTHH